MSSLSCPSDMPVSSSSGDRHRAFVFTTTFLRWAVLACALCLGHRRAHDFFLSFSNGSIVLLVRVVVAIGAISRSRLAIRRLPHLTYDLCFPTSCLPRVFLRRLPLHPGLFDYFPPIPMLPLTTRDLVAFRVARPSILTTLYIRARILVQ